SSKIRNPIKLDLDIHYRVPILGLQLRIKLSNYPVSTRTIGRRVATEGYVRPFKSHPSGETMKRIHEGRLESDLGYRFGYLAEFMGFGADDVTAIHESAKFLAPVVPHLVDAVYNKLFAYDATKRHFVPRQFGYEGPAPESLETLTQEHEQI